MLTRLAIFVGAASLLVMGVPANAADVTTTTHTKQGVVETFVDVVPSCEGGGPRYNITTTANTVTHRTRFADGSLRFHVTSTGTFVASPKADPSLPNYTGKFTQSGNFNIDDGDGTGTFTFSVMGTGSDGSSFATQTVDHFNERPNGTTQEFFHCR
jgi:hypothetical protein